MTFDYWTLLLRPVLMTGIVLLAMWDVSRDKKTKSSRKRKDDYIEGDEKP